MNRTTFFPYSPCLFKILRRVIYINRLQVEVRIGWIHARAVMHVGIANLRRRGKRPRHPRYMRNPQFLRIWQEAHCRPKMSFSDAITMIFPKEIALRNKGPVLNGGDGSRWYDYISSRNRLGIERAAVDVPFPTPMLVTSLLGWLILFWSLYHHSLYIVFVILLYQSQAPLMVFKMW